MEFRAENDRDSLRRWHHPHEAEVSKNAGGRETIGLSLLSLDTRGIAPGGGAAGGIASSKSVAPTTSTAPFPEPVFPESTRYLVVAMAIIPILLVVGTDFKDLQSCYCGAMKRRPQGLSWGSWTREHRRPSGLLLKDKSGSCPDVQVCCNTANGHLMVYA